MNVVHAGSRIDWYRTPPRLHDSIHVIHQPTNEATKQRTTSLTAHPTNHLTHIPPNRPISPDTPPPPQAACATGHFRVAEDIEKRPEMLLKNASGKLAITAFGGCHVYNGFDIILEPHLPLFPSFLFFFTSFAARYRSIHVPCAVVYGRSVAVRMER